MLYRMAVLGTMRGMKAGQYWDVSKCADAVLYRMAVQAPLPWLVRTQVRREVQDQNVRGHAMG